MRYASLNYITRSYLNQSRRPIHYYGRFLKYSNDCLREMLFDTLQIINTVRLPVNEFWEAELPVDMVDPKAWCKVGIQVGQFVRPLIPRDGINRLANIGTTDGLQITYPSITDETEEVYGGVYWWGVNTNSNGEDVGGYYGLGAGSEPDTFKIIEERNVIQLNQNITNSKVVLEYISDGMFSNAATKITPYAQRTIEAYIDWQYKEHSKSFGAYDAERAKEMFYAEYRKLRARKNELDPSTVERIINRHRKASLK